MHPDYIVCIVFFFCPIILAVGVVHVVLGPLIYILYIYVFLFYTTRVKSCFPRVLTRVIPACIKTTSYRAPGNVRAVCLRALIIGRRVAVDGGRSLFDFTRTDIPRTASAAGYKYKLYKRIFISISNKYIVQYKTQIKYMTYTFTLGISR